MVTLGKKLYPVSGRITKGGNKTMFSLPQSHTENGQYVQDGFINVLADGVYDFRRGDAIRVNKITGASSAVFKGTPYMTLFCEVTFSSAEEEAAAPNKQRLDEDIPEDLF